MGFFVFTIPIPINFTVDGAKSNYPVRLDIFSGVGTNSAGSIYLNNCALNWPYDIQFTNASSGTLSYFREQYDTASMSVWVKLDSIASSGTTNFYLSYRQAGFSDLSNGATTFPTFFEDFLGTSLNTSVWQASQTGYGTITIGSSIATFSQTPYGGQFGIQTKTDTYGFGIAARSRCNFISGGYSGIGFMAQGQYIQLNNNAQLIGYSSAYSTTSMTAIDSSGASFGAAAVAPLSTGGYHIYEVNRGASQGNSIYSHDNIAYTGVNRVNEPSNSTMTITIQAYANPEWSQTVDWILIRPTTAHEPTWASPGTQAVTAGFTTSTTVGLIGYTPIVVTDTTTGTLVATADWNWGDTTTHGTSLITASHIYYLNTGSFTLTFTVNGANTATQAIVISRNTDQSIRSVTISAVVSSANLRSASGGVCYGSPGMY